MTLMTQNPPSLLCSIVLRPIPHILHERAGDGRHPEVIIAPSFCYANHALRSAATPGSMSSRAMPENPTITQPLTGGRVNQ